MKHAVILGHEPFVDPEVGHRAQGKCVESVFHLRHRDQG